MSSPTRKRALPRFGEPIQVEAAPAAVPAATRADAKEEGNEEEQEEIEGAETQSKRRRTRTRNFGHVAGNWATFVSVDVAVGPETVARGVAHLDGAAETEAIAQPHASLSRTFPLREHQIEPFVEDVRSAVAGLGAFDLDGVALKTFMSENLSRRFAAVVVRKGRRSVLGLIRAVDMVVVAHQAPAFYANPEPHVSIAWAPHDGGRGADTGEDAHAAGGALLAARVSQVVVRAGDRSFPIPLVSSCASLEEMSR